MLVCLVLFSPRTRFGYRTVVILDYKIAKEAMASPDLADRPALFHEFSLDEKKKGGSYV